MPTKAKYVVLPGPVHSRKDGQIHSIGAPTLMNLYKVMPSECVVYYHDLAAASAGYKRANEWKLKLIHLTPRTSGDYRLPASAETKDSQ